MNFPDTLAPQTTANGTDYPSLSEFTRRALVAVGLITLAVAIGLAFAYAAKVFLLIFIGVLLAIFLRSLADLVGRYTGLSGGWSLAVVVLALVVLFAGMVWLFGSVLVSQLSQIANQLPQSLSGLRDTLRQYQWGQALLQHLPSLESLTGGQGQLSSRVLSFFSAALGVIGDLVVLLFLALYLAAQPSVYVNGLVKLVPPRKRVRIQEVLHSIGQVLRWWLLGQVIGMFVVGVPITIGLYLLGVPYALALGILAGLLMALVPYFGPILATIPALLIGLSQGPMTALYVLVLYLGVQVVQNYLVYPLVMKGTVELPPALVISVMVLGGVLFGILGLIAATPLTAAIVTAVKMLYIEDALHDPIQAPGERGS